MKDYTGKVCGITGAACGIGKAFALYAAEKGMRATVNADAHCAEALCFGFAPAREMLRQAGFSSVWVLRGGAFCEEEL